MARKNTKKRMRQPEAIEPDLFADEFFMDLPGSAESEPIWDEPEERPKIAADKRRAMVATITIFAVFAISVGGFTIYTKLIMPTPVTLGASSVAFTLPQAAPAPEVASAVMAAPPPIVAMATSTPSVVHTEAAPAASAEDTRAHESDVQPAVIAATPAPERAAAQTAAPVVTEPAIARAAPKRLAATQPSAPRATKSTADPNSLSAQAMRELNAGHPSEARQLAQQAVQTHPEQANGWIVLGAAHDALGNHDAAKAAYASCTARAFGARVATCRALAR